MTITYGVRERTRTADLRGHNPALCQLSYTQHLLVQMVGFEPTLKPILNRMRLPIAPHLQMVRPGGIGPPTHRLKVCCSTD